MEEISVEVYKYNPIFKDFLNNNDANYSFLENMKDKLKAKKWKNLTKEERCYYLSNKVKLYESSVTIKHGEQLKIDEMIEKKKSNILRLKEEIKEKEKFINDYQSQVIKENNSKFHIIIQARIIKLY